MSDTPEDPTPEDEQAEVPLQDGELAPDLEEEDDAYLETEEAHQRLPDGRPSLLETVPGAPMSPSIPLGLGLALGGALGSLGSGRSVLPGLAVIAGVGLAGMGVLAQQRARTPLRPYDLDPLNRAPGRITTTPVPGHGDIKVGRTDVRLADGTNRPFISIWIPPQAGSACAQAGGTYRWYQFVKVNFFIGQKRMQVRRGMEGATGLTYPFNQWTPDYHAGDPGTVGPDLRPPGLNLPAGVAGKPFKPYGIGGQPTAGGTSLLTGVLDAPDFTVRKIEKDGKTIERLSPIERLFRRFKRPREITQRNKPQIQRGTLKVVTEVRTYLVCVAGGRAQCIGYIAWTYTNEADITLDWRASATSMGINPTWKMTTQMTAVRHSLQIAGWTAGC